MENKCRKRSTAKRVLTIGILIVLIFGAVSMAASSIVLHVLFRRQPEDPYALVAVYAAGDAAGYPRQPVSFPSGHNTLRGYLYGAENDRGLIVIVNGFHATAETHLAETFYFVDDGWAVLVFDGTGVGESEGDSVVGLSQMRRDTLAALDFIDENEALSRLPLFLYGHSAGAYASATLCGDPRVSAVVCLSGFDSPLELMQYHARSKVGVLADIEYPFMVAWDWMTTGPDSGLSAWSCLMATDHPALVVQGTEDEIVPYELSLFAACESQPPDNVTLTLLEDEYRGSHSTAWLTSDAAREFLERREYKDEQTERYGDDLPEDVSQALADNADQARIILRYVDTDFLEEVSAFFQAALQPR